MSRVRHGHAGKLSQPKPLPPAHAGKHTLDRAGVVARSLDLLLRVPDSAEAAPDLLTALSGMSFDTCLLHAMA